MAFARQELSDAVRAFRDGYDERVRRANSLNPPELAITTPLHPLAREAGDLAAQFDLGYWEAQAAARASRGRQTQALKAYLDTHDGQALERELAVTPSGRNLAASRGLGDALARIVGEETAAGLDELTHAREDWRRGNAIRAARQAVRKRRRADDRLILLGQAIVGAREVLGLRVTEVDREVWLSPTVMRARLARVRTAVNWLIAVSDFFPFGTGEPISTALDILKVGAKIAPRLGLDFLTPDVTAWDQLKWIALELPTLGFWSSYWKAAEGQRDADEHLIEAGREEEARLRNGGDPGP